MQIICHGGFWRQPNFALPILVFFAALACSAPVLGQGEVGVADEVRKKYCNSAAARTEGFLKYLGEILRLKEKIEQIPPDTRQYLEREYKAALFPPNEQRFRLVAANQYYSAWRLLKELDVLELHRTSRSIVRRSDRAREVDHFVGAMRAVFDVERAFDAYDRFDSARIPRVLSEKDSEAWRFRLGIYQMFFHDLAVCAAS